MKYTIVSSANPGALADTVNSKLAIGWELYGSPCTTENWISQAMVLDDKKGKGAKGLETKWAPNP